MNRISPQGDPLRARSKSLSPKGFTLVELLIVIAVIAVLIALAIPGLTGIRRSAAQAREVSTARQLVAAYNAYALDHEGVLMPGYMAGLPALDQDGNPVSPSIIARRYPWRLAPYLDYDMRGMFLDPIVQEHLELSSVSTYVMSLLPSLGMNTIFVGGDQDAEEAYDPIIGGDDERVDLARTRLSQVRRSADLLVFASAREFASYIPGEPEQMYQGFFRIRPPYLMDREWADVFREEDDPGLFGNVSLRHVNRTAAVGFLDGSAAALTESEIQDMRHWADQATSPTWTLSTP